MEGLDEIGLTLGEDAAISGYEAKREAAHPWLVPAAG